MMPNMGPCCSTAVNCIIAENDFSANLDNMTIVSGSPSVSGGVLNMAAGDEVVFDDAATSSSHDLRFHTFADLSSSPGQLRLTIGTLYGELDISGGAGTIQVGSSAGALSGTVTLDDTGADLLANNEIALCWKPGALETSQEYTAGGEPAAATGTSWTDPGNIAFGVAGDALYLVDDTATNALVGTDFFTLRSIPAGSTINEVRASITLGTTGIADVADDTITLVADDGTTFSDKATGALVPSGSPGVMNYTWTSADWTGLTWQTVVSTGFGLSGQWICPNTGESDQLTVSKYSLAVDYTTPDRQPGTLTFTYRNNSTGNTQCVQVSNATNTALTGGIKATTGTWAFTEATFHTIVSASHPDCPDCDCDETGGTVDSGCCCPSATPPNQFYEADFGVGGWVDSSCCTGCDTVENAFILRFERNTDDAGPGLGCLWGYNDSLTTGCALRINLWLRGDGVSQCKWYLDVHITGNPNNCTNPQAVAATYESSALDTDGCQDTVTLTKVDDVSGDVCTGTLPNTISLSAA